MPEAEMKVIAHATKASQNYEELSTLLMEVAKIKPEVIVEIGSWHGYLLQTFYQAFPKARLFGIENDPSALGVLSKRISDGEFKDMKPPATLISNNSHDLGTKAILSTQLMDRRSKTPIDFLFIDADHTYEAVKQDFEMYAPMVRKGGIIALHDASLQNHPLVEVNRFWNDHIAGKYKCYITTAATETGKGIQKVGTGTGIILL